MKSLNRRSVLAGLGSVGTSLWLPPSADALGLADDKIKRVRYFSNSGDAQGRRGQPMVNQSSNVVIIETEGGKVEKQEYWGLRTLAYRIKKNRKGHYVLLNISAPGSAIFELERQLKINEDVLRYMSVRVNAFEQSNSSRKRERERDDDNRRREEREGQSEGAMG